MSDTISRRALIEWLGWKEQEYENRIGNCSFPFYLAIKEIKSGRFDILSTESDGEIESLKAITELAVKGLGRISEDAHDANTRVFARDILREIERLSHA